MPLLFLILFVQNQCSSFLHDRQHPRDKLLDMSHSPRHHYIKLWPSILLYSRPDEINVIYTLTSLLYLLHHIPYRVYFLLPGIHTHKRHLWVFYRQWQQWKPSSRPQITDDLPFRERENLQQLQTVQYMLHIDTFSISNRRQIDLTIFIQKHLYQPPPLPKLHNNPTI